MSSIQEIFGDLMLCLADITEKLKTVERENISKLENQDDQQRGYTILIAALASALNDTEKVIWEDVFSHLDEAGKAFLREAGSRCMGVHSEIFDTGH